MPIQRNMKEKLQKEAELEGAGSRTSHSFVTFVHERVTEGLCYDCLLNYCVRIIIAEL